MAQFNPVETFRQEAEELLAEIEQAALSLESGEHTEETVNQLFRSFHTIKGSGAMCGLDAVAGFTHHVESALDGVRNGTMEATPALAGMVLKSRDHIQTLLAAEPGSEGQFEAAGQELLAALAALVGAPSGAPPVEIAAAKPAAKASGIAQSWVVRFHPNPSLLAFGGSPMAVMRDLRKLGPCEITAHTGDVPELEAMQPDLCYLWWTARVDSACEENDIRDVFLFVEDGGKLEIEREERSVAAVLAPAAELAKPAVTAIAPRKAIAKESTVRVPSNRLDRLVNLVGELVMNHSRLAQAAAQYGAGELSNPVQELERLVAELRDNVLGIRMLPIGTLFGRFRRLVHDLSTELGKDVELITEGSETELDKSVLDQLGDPLVHCLRNCLDHGIEAPEVRQARGKPARGTIRLSAQHTGSDVVVSIQDDGKGIDRAAVRERAIEKGLIATDAELSDKDIFNLILAPGFSTAREVTSVSGRGVGMDAIKRQIDSLRGSLALASEEGKGTRVAITLPLTLAIIDGLLVEAGGDQFIVPMAAVTENVELAAAQRARNNGRNVIAVRGDLVPYIDLRQTFHLPGEPPAIEKVVIVQHEGDRVGMVVDRVLGTHQTVIQSLGMFFKNIEVVSGATIMGDGRVALILDLAAVVRHADRQCSGAPAMGSLHT